MPYTAPLKTSPSAQHIEHTQLTPNSCPNSPTVVSSHPPRPHLPRSYSSTSYVRRHRRSPSNSKAFTFPAPDHSSNPDHVSHSQSSIRKSPPPLSDAVIPPGALISPPDSAPNSSDEETLYRPQGELQLDKLEAAVRSIEQRRVSSPERPVEEEKSSSSMASSTADSVKHMRPPLSREARKISHSRSATESMVDHKQDEVLTTSPEESDRDDEPRVKHPMVRKKSGELVRPALRPASARRRPSSMPGTPTFSKAVHFDAQLEHIRHFLQLDKPQAVSADTSPVDDYDAAGEFPFRHTANDNAWEWEIALNNFPSDVSSRAHQRVRLERLHLSADKNTLIGVVAVANLAFHKHVAARFTLDHWKTVSEVTAEYNHNHRRDHANDAYDRFSFNIKLNDQTNLEKKTMFVCIRYNVEGQEYWDNNHHKNFQVNFIKTAKPRVGQQNLQPAKPRTSLPRSRSFVVSTSRPQSMPPSFDNFSDMDKYVSFGTPPKTGKEAPLCDDEPHDVEVAAPIRRDKQNHQVFGNRYDFEASLSAAMKTKPTHDRTTLAARAKTNTPPHIHHQHASEKRSTARDNSTIPTAGNGHQTSSASYHKPSTLVSSKPHRESSVYKELVDKYCFFGSSNFSTDGNDATTVRDFASRTNSSSSSSAGSPCSSPHIEAAYGGDSRTSSPSHIGFPYIQNNFLKETNTPAIIQG
ncbi:protein phosphatase regulator GAC1 [Aspergillus saccharolyticus JOP 1030-1]|uniref:CBM21 domain-containing protein n=1 Tax=Aspergillus saccharolyticus JOP 1030-1 TaxID=1450539 RepID=A0A318ZRG4_9EURO|nr:hypothetical protein BP01DRAFT_420221 [Aspergillus saccharolyticus JOP 1030-1]PYH49184.1 hypothetical protein BP01DRAFT_420221 [Aspergillus saccharolyticus JOP 1030-1]